MIPQRDQTTIVLSTKFKSRMTQQHTPLICLDEGFVPCQDDWGDGDDASPQDECWWGFFLRCFCLFFAFVCVFHVCQRACGDAPARVLLDGAVNSTDR